MHLLLGLSSLMLFLCGCFLTLRLLHHQRSWEQRRLVQCLVLSLPLVNLMLSLAGLHHFSGLPCLSNAPFWDRQIEWGIPILMGVITFGAMALGLVRLALMARVIDRTSRPVDSNLQMLVNGLAERLHAPYTRVRLCAYARPLALTVGTFRPTIVLSAWMLTQLDRRELEGVLAHELEHVARGDYPMMWLATLLRDAFFYVPTSWTAHRLLQQEKELACDEQVVKMTHRPLALASALTKVWLHAVEEPAMTRLGNAQYLVKAGEGEAINGRIERLLAPPESDRTTGEKRKSLVRWEMAALLGVFVLEIVNIIVMLDAMGCSPASLFGRAF